MKSLTCRVHRTLAAAARCQRCDVGMCDECWSWFHDSLPVCERCVAELRMGPATRWPFGAAFAVIAVVIAVIGTRLEGKPSPELWLPIAVLAVLIGLGIGFSSPRATGPEPNIVGREPDDAPPPEALHQAAHPYRARIARVTRRALPLSGRSTAIALSAAFVVSAVLLPVGLRLPRWIEIEIVLGAWWLAVAVLLTVLLYRGLRLVDDHRFALSPFGGSKKGDSKASDWANVGCADASGCGEAIVIVVALLVAAVAAWLLVEILVPVVFLFVYYFTVKAIGRVARDRHECAGRLPRSLGWGALFATVCVAPIAFLVWVIQTILAVRHGG